MFCALARHCRMVWVGMPWLHVMHFDATPLRGKRWVHASGARIAVEPFRERHGMRACMLAPTKIIAGLGMSLGIDRLSAPGATGAPSGPTASCLIRSVLHCSPDDHRPQVTTARSCMPRRPRSRRRWRWAGTALHSCTSRPWTTRGTTATLRSRCCCAETHLLLWPRADPAATQACARQQCAWDAHAMWLVPIAETQGVSQSQTAPL